MANIFKARPLRSQCQLRRLRGPHSWCIYDSYPYAINRADLRKYVILYAVGGFVADLDVQCLRPLTPLLDWLESKQHSCVVSEEPPLHGELLCDLIWQLSDALLPLR